MSESKIRQGGDDTCKITARLASRGDVIRSSFGVKPSSECNVLIKTNTVVTTEALLFELPALETSECRPDHVPHGDGSAGKRKAAFRCFVDQY